MEFDTDIVIAGGGLNGLTMALALRAGGFAVTLVDPVAQKIRSNAKFDGRSYALAIASKRVLATLGVWEQIADTSPILGIKVTDGRPGEVPSPLMLAFDHAEIEEGPMGFMAEDRKLRPALIAAARQAKVTQIEGDSVASQVADANSVTITLASGKALRAKLLIACDGKNSGIAASAGIKKTGWRYDQTALVCAIAHEKPHDCIAHQYFMPSGPLAILPLKGNRSSIVWTEKTAKAGYIQSLDDRGYLDELRPRFGSFLGDIELAGARFTYPLSLSIAETFIAERTALVGDAAHVVHPIAGQGLNAGLKDVAALAEVLTDAQRRGEDIGRADVLERYQRWRRFDTAALALATDTFNRMFSNDNSTLRLIRDIGLAATNAMPSMRRSLIREAAGLTGDLPRLAKGQAL